MYYGIFIILAIGAILLGGLALGSGPNNGDFPTDGYGIDPYMFPEDKYLDNDYDDDYY